MNGNGKTPIESAAPVMAVPTLDEIARDARKAMGLPRTTLKALLLKSATVQSALVAALTLEAEAQAPAVADNMLTIDEAAVKLRRSRRWIYRNADRLPFVRRLLSGKTLLCSEKELARWLERRRP